MSHHDSTSPAADAARTAACELARDVTAAGDAAAGDAAAGDAAAAGNAADTRTGGDEGTAGVLQRAFDGDSARLERFVDTLRTAVPEGTAIVLRGSTVTGTSFKEGIPFDAAGPGTSDLDIVLVGEGAVSLWVPEARVLGGINTLPLDDTAPWVAPAVEPARRQAQAIAGRPTAVQAMAGWFLDVRSVIQGQAYVVLSDS